MSDPITVALYQMKVCSREDENWDKVCWAAEEARRRGAILLLLPELWSSGEALEKAVKTAVPLGDGIFAKLSQLAQSQQICLLGSNFMLLDGNKAGNSAVFFGRDGKVQGVYTKIHLFRLMNEHRYFSAGKHLTLVDAGWGRIGLSICYDLRFPEVYRTYALGGAQLICVNAAWPQPRLAHWQVLLRARAIENQVFIAACNRVGKNGPLEFFGNSCIIDPWGETLIQAADQEALLTATISWEKINQVRATIPVFEDREEEAYYIDYMQ